MQQEIVLKYKWEHREGTNSWQCDLEGYSLLVYYDDPGHWRWCRITDHADVFSRAIYSAWQEAAKAAEDDL